MMQKEKSKTAGEKDQILEDKILVDNTTCIIKEYMAILKTTTIRDLALV